MLRPVPDRMTKALVSVFKQINEITGRPWGDSIKTIVGPETPNALDFPLGPRDYRGGVYAKDSLDRVKRHHAQGRVSGPELLRITKRLEDELNGQKKE